MDFYSKALEVINIEIDAIANLKHSLDASFNRACEILLNCRGRIVLIGMGKSGHIANKIAATFASTGTPSFFVHPAEASHGDLGMITKDDVVIAISYSGNTPEVLALLPHIKRLGVPVISISGTATSQLAQNSEVNLLISVSREACPLNLAPTASTTATLVLGDALAVALLKARGFTESDFALFHPGGSLGKRLLLHVSDIMHKGDSIPKVHPDDIVKDCVLEMTRKRLGMTTVCDEKGTLLGIYTDGDLRRSFEKNLDFYTTPIRNAMTLNPKTLKASELAAKGLQMMEKYKITSLVVTDDHQKVIGILHLHALLEAGVV
ncbi:MAG: KpsF/GutQ family sugar-phosphate isomerase [Gammaproteobacteria bacterium]|nr:KpsF/GutQ family sugar-phosphate isomerase [Gammaproteobacteria bacterium]